MLLSFLLLQKIKEFLKNERHINEYSKIIPKTPNNDNVIPYVDEAIK